MIIISSSEIYNILYILSDNMKYLKTLIESKNTVFTTSELKILLKIKNASQLNVNLQTIKKQNIVKNLWYGIRTLNNYDKLELASKLRKNSYISLEYVLQKSGIIFQSYEKTITLAGNNTFTKEIDWLNFEFHKIKPSILTNPLWLVYTWKYYIATPERAICDMIYLYKNITFDNIQPLNVELLSKLSEIYPNTTSLLINKLIKNVKSRKA